MTNILGVNCSQLGRKTLLVINLLTLTIRYFVYLLQSFFVDWPDWVFYVGSFIESLSGSTGIFYLALYCFISDLTPPSERSYRITFINNLNSIASLCVTGICGYVIKYYGYFYLFLTSWLLIIISLIYTIFFIPEPLAELKGVSFWSRLKSCSIRKSSNCLKVYFDNNEEDSPGLNKPTKQSGVLLLVVFVNFVYVFATQGIASIFTLYIMNAPYCFDSVDISQFSIFTTVVSLVSHILFFSPSKKLKFKKIFCDQSSSCVCSSLSSFALTICSLMFFRVPAISQAFSVMSTAILNSTYTWAQRLPRLVASTMAMPGQ